jgi:hypothetical protein
MVATDAKEREKRRAFESSFGCTISFLVWCLGMIYMKGAEVDEPTNISCLLSLKGLRVMHPGL